MKNVLIFFLIISFFSCEDPGGEKEFEGFQFSFSNATNKELNAKIIIAGKFNGVFIPTDSTTVKGIKAGINNSPPFFVDEKRWKPNLAKIINIPSDRCYFTLKLSDNRTEMVGRFQSSELFSLLVIDKSNFIGDEGDIIISITDEEITASTVAE
ncbi:hypothetical protein [uncultured Polaribacter sp.]|uniref:hypothetical protein n=1 Tax=uncultured Polaribacter sp. TaxID=174711 RepID=UPI00262F25DB|nr:hypothetical protein [uncultured Polaribacter sp.]